MKTPLTSLIILDNLQILKENTFLEDHDRLYLEEIMIYFYTSVRVFKSDKSYNYRKLLSVYHFSLLIH